VDRGRRSHFEIGRLLPTLRDTTTLSQTHHHETELYL
jgi:hypothetical protein